MIELCVYLLLNLCVDSDTNELVSCDTCQEIVIPETEEHE